MIFQVIRRRLNLAPGSSTSEVREALGLHNRTISSGAWITVMSYQQVFQHCVQAAMLFATQFGVLVKRDIPGSANLFDRAQDVSGFSLERL
jgi:hypothetical protein